MRCFANFVAIDWSGAKGERHAGIAVATACGSAAPHLVRPGHRWSRGEVVGWLAQAAEDSADMLVGFDFSAAFAHRDSGAYFPGWDDSPADMPALWALIERLCAPDAHLGVQSFLDHPAVRRHFRHARGDVGDQFGTGIGRLRVVEAHQRATGQAASWSNFNLVGAGQVGKASLAGMRLLHRLHPALPFWPLEPVPTKGPLLIEIYTSIAARAAGLRAGLSKIRDGAALDQALAALGSRPTRLTGPISDHAADALLTAAWLRAVAHDPALWSPTPLTADLARTEGWTFGIV
jgi:hypothetical protein